VLVVDRYAGYNQAPCARQYCYAHLLREVEDLAKEFPADAEVQRFATPLGEALAQAMQLRGRGLTRPTFGQEAARLRGEIQAMAAAPARHPGVQKIRGIFREQAEQLYHWARHPSIPAENNRAERELRPLVIARKLSFGSRSARGLRTREVLMSILHTLGKRTDDVFTRLVQTLDTLAAHPQRRLYPLLFNSS